MIVEYLRYKIAEAQRAVFEAAYEKAQPSLKASSHVHVNASVFCQGDVHIYSLFSKFAAGFLRVLSVNRKCDDATFLHA